MTVQDLIAGVGDQLTPTERRIAAGYNGSEKRWAEPRKLHGSQRVHKRVTTKT